jgi:anti-anti-sigma regulatory factor
MTEPTTDPSSAVKQINFPPVTNEAVAEDLLRDLRACLADGQSVIINASNVDEIGTMTIQVIETAAEHFGAAGLRLGLAEPSDACVSAYEDLGLFARLMNRIADVEPV